MAEKIKCKTCGYEYTSPPDFCPRCLTKPESSQTVAELARAYGIKYWHRLPSLPELEDKPENRRLLAVMIDEEGAIGTAYIYRDRYHYLIPFVGYGSETKGLSELAGKLMRYNRRVLIHPKLTPKEEIYWHIYERRGDAIAIILMCKKYFIKNKEKAERVLALFEEAPYLRVASKEEAYRIKREAGL